VNILKQAVAAATLAAGLALPGHAVSATGPQWVPTKPIKLILGYTPGGAADATAREIAGVMEKILGQPMVVDYRPGAAGSIGAEAVANAAPDGYTVGLIDSAPLTIIPTTRKVPYDPVTGFAYVGVVAQSPLVILVNPTLPVRTLPELIQLARKKPGALSFSTSGLGSIHQMSAELLKAETGTFMTHVPYRGAAPALNDLMGGQVEVSFATIAPAIPIVQSGRARAIAVTSDREVPSFPGVRPVSQQGVPGYDAQGWFVMALPKGTPQPVIERLNAALNETLNTPAVKDKLVGFGNDISASTPNAASLLVKRDFEKWARVVRVQQLKFE